MNLNEFQKCIVSDIFYPYKYELENKYLGHYY